VTVLVPSGFAPTGLINMTTMTTKISPVARALPITSLIRGSSSRILAW